MNWIDEMWDRVTEVTDDQQFHQCKKRKEKKEQSHLLNLLNTSEWLTTTCAVRWKSRFWLGQAHKCGRVKPANGIVTLPKAS